MSEKVQVLVVDDQEDHAEAMVEALERADYVVTQAVGGETGIRRLRETPFDIVVTDLMMDDADGMAVLQAAREGAADTEVIMVTGHGSVENAVHAMQRGAYHYLLKPFDIAELREVVKRAAEKQALTRRTVLLERQLDEKYGFEKIIGQNATMLRMLQTTYQIAHAETTVLIQGESGTGKELIARAIHQNSARRRGPFVALNCAALSEGILESELFGHEKGAFTGAIEQRIGRFEYAQGGTLLLDEVGDLPIPTQIKLLRVIEQREVFRVGSNTAIPVNVRLLAATHRDLEALVEQERFRNDLYFRLKVVTLKLPPLRERRDDIPLLVEAFIREFAASHQKSIKGIIPSALQALQRYDWPGNVRELRNAIESMIAVTRNEILDIRDLPEPINPAQEDPSIGSLAGLTMEEVEKRMIREALKRLDGNRAQVAKALGIGERTLYRKIREYRLG